MRDSDRPRVLVFGAGGQVGWEAIRSLAPFADVRALDRQAVDLADFDALRAAVRSSTPDIIVNAAAYTQVERAESEATLANRINGEAPGVLAAEAARLGALLVHFSTDYVFDGMAARPYVESDPVAPQNVYGSSKLAGDQAVLASEAEAYIFRVGWVYGRRGRNFLATIERIAREQGEIRVVADQHGAPTWSRSIADATARAVVQWLGSRGGGAAAPARGVYHMAAPDHASWYEFASAIVERMQPAPGRKRPSVLAISTAEYPTLARRPAWTVLDSGRLLATFGVALPAWREQLGLCLANDA